MTDTSFFGEITKPISLDSNPTVGRILDSAQAIPSAGAGAFQVDINSPLRAPRAAARVFFAESVRALGKTVARMSAPGYVEYAFIPKVPAIALGRDRRESIAGVALALRLAGLLVKSTDKKGRYVAMPTDTSPGWLFRVRREAGRAMFDFVVSNPVGVPPPAAW
jgi:hypothetical protein